MSIRLMKALLKLVVVIAVFALIIMFLWNALMPELFGLSTVNFLQAIGLLALCRFLFGGFGFAKDWGHFTARHERRAMRDSWRAMTPEQRAQYMNEAQKTHHFGKKIDGDGSEV